MFYVLISGKRNSGKNYIGEMIATGISKDRCHLCAFADIPKRLMKFNENNREEKEQNREKLIEFAQKEKKKDKYVWCRKLYEETKDLDVDFVVITDWRFKDEYNFLKRKSSSKLITIRINDNSYRNEKVDNHISETELDTFKFDYYVNNSKT